MFERVCGAGVTGNANAWTHMCGWARQNTSVRAYARRGGVRVCVCMRACLCNGQKGAACLQRYCQQRNERV